MPSIQANQDPSNTGTTANGGNTTAAGPQNSSAQASSATSHPLLLNFNCTCWQNRKARIYLSGTDFEVAADQHFRKHVDLATTQLILARPSSSGSPPPRPISLPNGAQAHIFADGTSFHSPFHPFLLIRRWSVALLRSQLNLKHRRRRLPSSHLWSSISQPLWFLNWHGNPPSTCPIAISIQLAPIGGVLYTTKVTRKASTDPAF